MLPLPPKHHHYGLKKPPPGLAFAIPRKEPVGFAFGFGARLAKKLFGALADEPIVVAGGGTLPAPLPAPPKPPPPPPRRPDREARACSKTAEEAQPPQNEGCARSSRVGAARHLGTPDWPGRHSETRLHVSAGPPTVVPPARLRAWSS